MEISFTIWRPDGSIVDTQMREQELTKKIPVIAECSGCDVTEVFSLTHCTDSCSCLLWRLSNASH